ncbi:hypothetical protein Tco_0951203 [Tanacetum coccineum]|uniref:Uncharacterized protein n=1 Tax=Tanacetum coccineum TaxID=301880 RepID=A0ABQ5DUA0_9ASTR
MEDLNLCALNATITMMVRVLPNATSETELAIWPVTVGVLQMPILLTTKGALGRYGETQSEAVKLLIFPFSLCDEAETWTEPQAPPQAYTEQVNVVFTGSGKSDDPSKT